MIDEERVNQLAVELCLFVDDWGLAHPSISRTEIMVALGIAISLYTWKGAYTKGQSEPLKSDN